MRCISLALQILPPGGDVRQPKARPHTEAKEWEGNTGKQRNETARRHQNASFPE